MTTRDTQSATSGQRSGADQVLEPLVCGISLASGNSDSHEDGDGHDDGYVRAYCSVRGQRPQNMSLSPRASLHAAAVLLERARGALRPAPAVSVGEALLSSLTVRLLLCGSGFGAGRGGALRPGGRGGGQAPPWRGRSAERAEALALRASPHALGLAAASPGGKSWAPRGEEALSG